MVAKINVGTSLYGALAYNGLKVNEGEGKLLAVNKVFDDGSGRVDIARAVEDFRRYMPEKCRRMCVHGTRSSTSPSIRIPTTA